MRTMIEYDRSFSGLVVKSVTNYDSVGTYENATAFLIF